MMQLVDKSNPILRLPTIDYNQDEIAGLSDTIEEMFNILNNGGIGLAAPQVGINKSLFVISIDNIKKVFINPAILSTNGTMSTEEEGCLSLPGLRLKISRPTEITVAWLDEHGIQKVSDLSGLWARCWLHEYDHLQGILIEDRVSKLALDFAKKKILKKQKLARRQYT